MRRAMQLAPWIKLFGGVRMIRKKIRANLIALSADPSWVSDSVVDGYTAGAARDLDGTLRGYLAMAASRERERLEPRLSAITRSLLLVLGRVPHGGRPTPGRLGQPADSLRAFTVDTVAGAGHFVHEERPDAVVAAVSRVGPASALSAAGSRGSAKP